MLYSLKKSGIFDLLDHGAPLSEYNIWGGPKMPNIVRKALMVVAESTFAHGRMQVNFEKTSVTINATL